MPLKRIEDLECFETNDKKINRDYKKLYVKHYILNHFDITYNDIDQIYSSTLLDLINDDSGDYISYNVISKAIAEMDGITKRISGGSMRYFGLKCK